ncbi:MAG: nuclear transport factor 2 family protein [Clostridium sp.]|uniref:nuclear transport factor 2 family protein n=1 Tax=Clostridium sp. TaxID=1506 RepID=UPI0039EBD1F2
MITKLPQPIGTYFSASNAYESEALKECFTEDALLIDEGKEYHGPDAIDKQITETNKGAQVKTKVTDTNEKNREIIVTAIVSGNFDGSPVSLDFQFTLQNQKISRLKIVLTNP